jgi:hypothetical protein
MSELADPWEEINIFIQLCSQVRLSGIHEPFYRDWAHTDPTWFLTPDRLHAVLKRFWDHDVKWCAAALGEAELSFRFSAIAEVTASGAKVGVFCIIQLSSTPPANR